MAVANAQASRTEPSPIIGDWKTLKPRFVECGEILIDKIISTNRFEVSLLVLFPGAKIKKHTHVTDEEFYYCINEKVVTKCNVGESHDLANNGDEIMFVLSVKYACNPSLDCMKATVLYHIPQFCKDYENGKAFSIDILNLRDKKINICILTNGGEIKEHTHPDYEEIWLDLQEKAVIMSGEKTKHVVNNTNFWKFYIVAQFDKTNK